MALSLFFIPTQTKFVQQFFFIWSLHLAFFFFLLILVSNFSVYAILHVISYAEFLKYMYVNKYTAGTVYEMCMDFILFFCSEITFPFISFFFLDNCFICFYKLAFMHMMHGPKVQIFAQTIYSIGFLSNLKGF